MMVSVLVLSCYDKDESSAEEQSKVDPDIAERTGKSKKDEKACKECEAKQAECVKKNKKRAEECKEQEEKKARIKCEGERGIDPEGEMRGLEHETNQLISKKEVVKGCVKKWRFGSPDSQMTLRAAEVMEYTEKWKAMVGYEYLCDTNVRPIEPGADLRKIPSDYRPIRCKGCVEICMEPE
jgi:hypothetical protein